MSIVDDAEKLIARMSRGEKAQLLQTIAATLMELYQELRARLVCAGVQPGSGRPESPCGSLKSFAG